MTDDTKKEAGRRGRTMRFRVTADEGQEIEARAARAGLTPSAYLRAAALNHPIRSIYDLDAADQLMKVNGDLGRVAGLLKLWLAEKPGQGASRHDVNRMMADFRALQSQLSTLVGRALK
ncbi:TPA: CopG family transcriptional regulator [Pseudomonas aeruginosa]